MKSIQYAMINNDKSIISTINQNEKLLKCLPNLKLRILPFEQMKQNLRYESLS